MQNELENGKTGVTRILSGVDDISINGSNKNRAPKKQELELVSCHPDQTLHHSIIPARCRPQHSVCALPVSAVQRRRRAKRCDSGRQTASPEEQEAVQVVVGLAIVSTPGEPLIPVMHGGLRGPGLTPSSASRSQYRESLNTYPLWGFKMTRVHF